MAKSSVPKAGGGKALPPLSPENPLPGPVVLDATIDAHRILNILDSRLKDLQDLSTQMRAKLNEIHDPARNPTE